MTAITTPGGASPVRVGDRPIAPFPSEYTLTYLNFGRVDMDGLDVGVSYRASPTATLWANYSWSRLVDLEDPGNDFNSDGRFEELSFNTPEQKGAAEVALDEVATAGLGVSASARWVQE